MATAPAASIDRAVRSAQSPSVRSVRGCLGDLLIADQVAAAAAFAAVLVLGACGRTQPFIPPDNQTPGFDAGPTVCADPSATWLTPGTSDCLARCPAGAVALVESPSPLCWCRCGFGKTDLTAGCSEDQDCMISQADCCSCAGGGTEIPLLKASLTEWWMQLSHHCSSRPHCFAEYDCTGAQAVCQNGHCVLSN
jgi:hypothetical protein